MSSKLLGFYADPGLFVPPRDYPIYLGIDGNYARAFRAETQYVYDLVDKYKETKSGPYTTYDNVYSSKFIKLDSNKKYKIVEPKIHLLDNDRVTFILDESDIEIYIIQVSVKDLQASTLFTNIIKYWEKTQDRRITWDVLSSTIDSSKFDRMVKYHGQNGKVRLLREYLASDGPDYTNQHQLDARRVTLTRFLLLEGAVNILEIPLNGGVPLPPQPSVHTKELLYLALDFDLALDLLEEASSYREAAYLPIDYRAISISDEPFIAVKPGQRVATRSNIEPLVRTMYRLSEQFKSSFDIGLRNQYTDYVTLYIRFQRGDPFLTSQLYLRVPSSFKTNYALMQSPLSDYVIDNITDITNLNLRTSDMREFVEIATPNAGYAAAVVGGLGSGIASASNNYMQYQMWADQLKWQRERQANDFAFRYQFQKNAFEFDKEMAEKNQILRGYRTEGAARGLVNNRMFTMPERMNFGNTEIYGSQAPATAYTPTQPFIRSHVQTSSSAISDSERGSSSMNVQSESNERESAPPSLGST